MNKEQVTKEKNMQLNFENVVDYSIVRGYQQGMEQFMQELDQTLEVNTIIEEAGGIDNVINVMLENSQKLSTNFDEVSSTLDQLMS